MSKRQPRIEIVVIESHQKNKEIGKQFYYYILEQIKKIKGENDNEKTKAN